MIAKYYEVLPFAIFVKDDLDVPIKRCFDDSSFAAEHNLISLNSINWARVLIQAVHFVYAFLKFNPEVDEAKTVEFLVPTGACGNVTGGCLAGIRPGVWSLLY